MRFRVTVRRRASALRLRAPYRFDGTGRRPADPRKPLRIARVDAIGARRLTTRRHLPILRAMTFLAHTQWHRSTVEETAAAGVYLRLNCDSSKRSPLFALIPANGTEPGP